MMMMLYRERDVRHGGTVEAGRRVRVASRLRSIPAGLSARSAVRVTWHLPPVQQNAVSRAPAVHLLRAAGRSFAAA